MDLKSIVENSQNISLETSSDATKFCQIWPEVEEGLQLLQSLIKNPIAKISVGTVIAAGEAIAKEVCKTGI